METVQNHNLRCSTSLFDPHQDDQHRSATVTNSNINSINNNRILRMLETQEQIILKLLQLPQPSIITKEKLIKTNDLVVNLLLENNIDEKNESYVEEMFNQWIQKLAKWWLLYTESESRLAEDVERKKNNIKFEKEIGEEERVEVREATNSDTLE